MPDRPLCPSPRTVHYYAELGQCSVLTATDAPERFVGQVTVLKYFSHYMEENLMDVSTGASRGVWVWSRPGVPMAWTLVLPPAESEARGGGARDLLAIPAFGSF